MLVRLSCKCAHRVAHVMPKSMHKWQVCVCAQKCLSWRGSCGTIAVVFLLHLPSSAQVAPDNSGSASFTLWNRCCISFDTLACSFLLHVSKVHIPSKVTMLIPPVSVLSQMCHRVCDGDGKCQFASIDSNHQNHRNGERAFNWYTCCLMFFEIQSFSVPTAPTISGMDAHLLELFFAEDSCCDHRETCAGTKHDHTPSMQSRRTTAERPVAAKDLGLGHRPSGESRAQNLPKGSPQESLNLFAAS